MFIERLTVIMYKYEMHLHSSLTSKCATSDSVEYVKRAVETGFAGMVLTNHFYRGNSPEENIKAMEFAKKNDLICIGGGDTHSTSGFGAAGIILPQRVSGGKELVEMLKARKARLISGGLFTEGDLYE